MTNEIEMMERKGRACLKGYLVAFYIFMILWIVRFFFRESGLNDQPVGHVVLAGLIILVFVQLIYMSRLAVWKRKVKADSKLDAAINNELVRLYEMRSWKTAYIAAVCSTFFFAVVSLSYPICDPMLVALTALIVGGGAYMTSLYVLNRER